MNNLQSILAILPVIIVVLTGMVVLLGDSCIPFWKKLSALSGNVSLIGIFTAMSIAIERMVHQPTHVIAFHGALSIGSFSQACSVIILIMSALAVLLALTYLENQRLNRGEYYALVLFSTSGAMLMCAANDLIVLFVAVELLSVSLYVLTGFASTKKKSEEAALKYFLLGAFATGFLLYGIALIYGGSYGVNSTNLIAIHRSLSNVASTMLISGVGLLLCGLGFKAALVPFHMWSPDVYEGAPTSVTAFMAAIVKVAAFAALLRIFSALSPLYNIFLPVIEVLSILSMIVGNLYAVTQTNVKRLLAYSSVAHAGYLLIAVAAVGNPAAHDSALRAAIFYFLAYGLTTIGSFGLLVYLSHKQTDCETLDDLRGLAKSNPMAAAAMVIFMLSLGGIPPTIGFIGKWYLFTTAIQAHLLILAVVLALTSMIAVFYYLRVVWVICFSDTENSATQPANSPAGAQGALMVSSLLCVLGGIAPVIAQPLMLAAQALSIKP